MPKKKTKSRKPKDSNASESLAGNEAYNLEHLMAYRYAILYKLMSRYSAAFLNEQFELSIAEWRILGQLAYHEEGTVAELAQRTLTDKAQISRSVQSLHKRKLVRRRPHASDSRRVVLSLSKRGVEFVRKVFPHRSEFNEQLLSQLSQREQRSLNNAIGKLTAYLESELGSPS
jgi:DNA-binding MarR family transcriptional regulator